MEEQLDIKITFWSEADSAVKLLKLKTYWMGHATGVFLAEKLFFSFEDNEMILLQLQSLGSDGPNATKIVWNK